MNLKIQLNSEIESTKSDPITPHHFPSLNLPVNTGTERQSECVISCSEPMPKLSYSKRFSMSRRRYWSKFQNDRVIFWCSIWHFAFDRLETSVNEILSNLIVYSLKYTKNRHRLSCTKTLAHYLYGAHHELLGQARGCPRTHQSAAVG